METETEAVQVSILERRVYLFVGLLMLAFVLVLVLINPGVLKWLFGGGALLALLGALFRSRG